MQLASCHVAVCHGSVPCATKMGHTLGDLLSNQTSSTHMSVIVYVASSFKWDGTLLVKSSTSQMQLQLSTKRKAISNEECNKNGVESFGGMPLQQSLNTETPHLGVQLSRDVSIALFEGDSHATAAPWQRGHARSLSQDGGPHLTHKHTHTTICVK